MVLLQKVLRAGGDASQLLDQLVLGVVQGERLKLFPGFCWELQLTNANDCTVNLLFGPT